MEDLTSGSQSQTSGSVSHGTQADLVRSSLLGPGAIRPRRYALGSGAVCQIRSRVHMATLNALSDPGCSAEHVATAAALEAERAIFAVGVERLND